MKLITSLIFLILLNFSTMAFEIKTAININATPEKVWSILTHFGTYPNWNPFIKSIEGTVQKDEKIKIQITPPDSKEMTFRPKVLTFSENKELVWIGRLLIPGVFDGKHKFELIDNNDGTTTFIQSEKFKGILVPFLKKKLNKNTKDGFILMNEKLKELAEN